MIINHNVSSIFANRQFKATEQNLDSDIRKLSSGERINMASDDASGLAVSEKMRSQVRGLYQAMRNTEDAISFLQTAEGYLDETSNILQRMRELSVQAANGTYDYQDRMLIGMEMSQLMSEVDRVSSAAEFNSKKLLNGFFAASPSSTAAASTAASTGLDKPEELYFHIGPNMDQRIKASIENMSAKALGLFENNEKLVKVEKQDDANKSIGVINQAIEKVLKTRSDLGSFQNRFEKLYKGLYVAYENTQAAESRIRDTNMAEQMSNFVKNQILSQANVSMLAQANLKPQLVLRLLG